MPMDMPGLGVGGRGVVPSAGESPVPGFSLGSVFELDALFDQAPAALAFLDPGLRVRRVNAALCRLAGLPGEAIIGRRPSEIGTGTGAALIEGILAGQVLAAGVPVAGRLLEQTLAGQRRVLSWSACRVTGHGQVRGVLCSLTDVTGLAATIGRSDAGLDLLQRAGNQIGTTLDIHRTAAEHGDLAVPGFADRVTIDLLDHLLHADTLPRPGAGTLPFRRVALRDTSTTRASAGHHIGDLITRPLTCPAATALRHGQPLLARTPAEIRRQAAYTPARAGTLLARGIHTRMLIPLIARGTTLGTAFFGRAEHPDPYDHADLRLATDLATRAAVCIDNARLYTREHTTALTLQRSLLPRHIPPVTGLRIARRYQPASQTAEVGGDWLDVIPLTTGQVALVIGDVTGHSIHAAAIMGQLRTTTTALTRLGCPPHQIMTQLSDVLTSHDDETGATCLYALYDPATRHCRLTSAGHPPPALSRPDGTTTFPDIPAGLMLGAGPSHYPATDLHLPPGSTLALYTDGLIDQPRQDITTGMTRLAHALATTPPPPLDHLCDTILATLGTSARDDIALLLARTTTHPH